LGDFLQPFSAAKKLYRNLYRNLLAGIKGIFWQQAEK
jgi:hypothetical protein